MTVFAGELEPRALTDETGQVQPAATVSLRTLAGALATAYADRDRTALANPVPTGVATGAAGLDDNAMLTLWADPGRYLVRSVVGATTTEYPVTVNRDPDEPPEVTQVELDAVAAAGLLRPNHTGTQSSATISDFTEAVQDAVAALLGAGSNVTLNYDDAGNTLTVTASGAGGLDAEAVRDAIGVALVGTGVVSVTVNDALDTITISSTATVNSTDAALRDRSTHTGTQSADTLTDGTTNKAFLATERTKLAGVATGATANAADAVLEARANHTGTQPATTISDLAATVAGFALTDFPAGLARDSEVTAAVAALVAAAPGTLDTLDELAAALGDDPNFATTLATSLAAKVDKATFDANTILKADTDDTPSALAIAASTVVGRKATGGIAALTVAELRTLLALAIADVTGLQAALDLKATLASPALTGNPTAPTPSQGDNDTSIATTAYAQTELAFKLEAPTFSVTGAVVVATGKSRFYVEGNYTIASVRASADTAPTGATLIVDVNKNGTTVFTTQGNRPAIAISGNTATGTPDVTTLAAGDFLSVDVDQVGSTVAGSDLTVTIRLRRTS